MQGLSGLSGLSGLVGGSSAAAAWTPASLSGLVLWLKADAGAFSDAGTTPAVNNDPVQQWNDQSGQGNHVSQGTAANRPLYITGAQNSLPALRFDGSNDRLANTVANLVPAGSAFTVALVAVNTAVGGGALFTVRLTTTYATTAVLKNDTTHSFVHGDGINGFANIEVSQPQNDKLAWFQATWDWKGAASNPDVYWNGTLLTVTSAGTHQTTENGTTGFQIGANVTGQFWTRDIGELIVCGTLTSGVRAQLAAYLKARWGTP